jgi:hypothetical protein
MTERQQVAQRAGTQLDHRFTRKIMSDGKEHGLLDERQRIYQSGGELKNFVYWKLVVVSFDAKVWEQIAGKVDWFEMLDHPKNECYRISADKAYDNLVDYVDRIGPRVGIPLDRWDIVTAEDETRYKAP